METILFINACMRGRKISRTYELADTFLQQYCSKNECQLQEIDLSVVKATPLDAESLARREALLALEDFAAPELALALQFAAADKIVVAAPFWDLSFPAALKAYLENICVNKITFAYEGDGKIRGRCRAEKMMYITTRGGIFSGPAMQNYEMAIPYLKALSGFLGIKEFASLSAEGLDIIGQDAEKIIEIAREEAIIAAQSF